MAIYIVSSQVYDVSGWNDHPGGNVIFTTVGEDGKELKRLSFFMCASPVVSRG